MFRDCFRKLAVFFRWIVQEAVRHPMGCLMILWGMSLALKLLCLWGEPILGRDASFYVYSAREWHETGIYPVHVIPPMLYTLIRGGMFCGFDAEVAGWIVNIGLASFLVFVTYGIAFEAVKSKKIALVAALFTAIHPVINDLAIEIQREIPYLFFAGLTLWMAVAALQRKKWFLWGGAGIFCALSMVTRYESAELVILIPLIILIQAFGRKIPWKNAAGYLGIFYLAAVSLFFAFFYLTGTQKFLKRYDAYGTYKIKRVENWYEMRFKKEKKQ